jgi:hypothetical protein
LLPEEGEGSSVDVYRLDKFVNSGKLQLRKDSDDDVEDSGWEDDEDDDL